MLIYNFGRKVKKSHRYIDNFNQQLSFDEIIDLLGISTWEPQLVRCNDGGTNGDWFRIQRVDKETPTQYDGYILHPNKALSAKSKLLSNASIISLLKNTLESDPSLYINQAALLNSGERLVINFKFKDEELIKSSILGTIEPNVWLSLPIAYYAFRQLIVPVMLRCTNQIPNLKAKGLVGELKINHLNTDKAANALFNIQREVLYKNITDQVNLLEQLSDIKWNYNRDFPAYVENVFDKPINKITKSTVEKLKEIYKLHPGCVEFGNDHNLMRGYNAMTRYYQYKHKNDKVTTLSRVPGTNQFNWLNKASVEAYSYAKKLTGKSTFNFDNETVEFSEDIDE